MNKFNDVLSTPEQFYADLSKLPHAQRFIASGFNVNALRTNDLLRKDEWIELDTAVVDIARARLVIVADLLAGGLRLPLGGLGSVISQFEKASDMSAADIDMSGVAPGEEDSVQFTLVSIPIPVTHKDFRINIRRLEASRKLGDSIDVTQAATAGRRVADALDSTVFNGASGIVVDASSLRGLTDHPDRNTATGSDWGTIANIYTDVTTLVDAAEADNYFGPYNLYVAKTQFGQMRNVYTDGSGQNALDRVLKNQPSIKAVKPGDALTAGVAVLVQMTRDVVDYAVAMDVSTIEWTSRGGWVFHFMVVAVSAPRIKSDADARSGVVHMTGI